MPAVAIFGLACVTKWHGGRLWQPSLGRKGRQSIQNACTTCSEWAINCLLQRLVTKKKKKENGGVAHPMCVVSVALSPLVRNAGDAVVEASRVCGHLKRGKDKHHHSFLSKFLSSLGTEWLLQMSKTGDWQTWTRALRVCGKATGEGCNRKARRSRFQVQQVHRAWEFTGRDQYKATGYRPRKSTYEVVKIESGKHSSMRLGFHGATMRKDRAFSIWEGGYWNGPLQHKKKGTEGNDDYICKNPTSAH